MCIRDRLPDAAETMNALSEAEKTAVSLLLKAYIGFLSEEATLSLIHILLYRRGACRCTAVLVAPGACGKQHGCHVYDAGHDALLPAGNV